MEQLNRVELRGVVGSVRVCEACGKKLARMTVATNLAYRGKDGCAVIETTWHSVVAFEGENICSLDSISRGDYVEVTGRIRNQRTTREDGLEVLTSEIQASRLSKLDIEGPLQYQL